MFKTQYKYRKHIVEYHATERKYHCPICNITFNILKQYNDHMSSDGLCQYNKEIIDPYECIICQRYFYQKKFLINHCDKVHGDTEEIYCNFCEKKCIGQKSMQLHKAIYHRILKKSI